MDNNIIKILASKTKHKELVAVMTEKAKGDKKILAQLFEILKTGSDVEKGTAAEVMKFVSKDNPELMVAYIDVLIDYIDYKAPRVRWGCPESIGNLAQKYPDEVEKAIPKLMDNLMDKSTVVRWCAAYTLSEIIRSNEEARGELVPRIEEMLNREQNTGVKNVYLRY